MIPSGNISALTQNSFCRCLKHASPVADMQGNVAESYVYDPAGNILSKTVNGKTTTYTYDKANQLVSSTTEGKVIHYAYDAAGRLVKEGDKSYAYGWLDKVMSVSENGQKIASFNYHNDGQIAQAIRNGKSEDFLWDGLALIHRGETSFINEPYVTGGNPILSSKDGVMFNDMLGSTLNIGGKSVSMTAFGESADNDAMYTGKPYIGELGYAFLFRNYRADQGKWLTTDPLGYPDGWNNLAYCGNKIIDMYDRFGMCPDGFPASVSVERTLIGEPIYGPFTYTFDSTNNTYTLYLPWSIHYKEDISATDIACGCICMGQHCGVHHVDESSEEHQLSAPLYNMIVSPTEEVNENNLEEFMNVWMAAMIKNIKKSISDFLNKDTTIVRVFCE